MRRRRSARRSFAPRTTRRLAQALHGSADIVVFQHGSDWNRLGERLLADVWNRSELDKALATNNVVLVAVDQPETSGNPAVAGAPPEDARPVYGPVDTPPARLARLLKEEPVPASEISIVECGGGTTYTRLEDGTFLASGANPGQDVLVLTPHRGEGRGGRAAARLPDPSQPARQRPGARQQRQLRHLGGRGGSSARSLASVGAWAGLYEGGWGPWQAVDGVTDNDDNLWNAFGHRHQNGLLLVALEKPVAPGTRVVVRLVCKAKWAQHLPGTLRATILDDARMAADVGAVGRADALGSMTAVHLAGRRRAAHRADGPEGRHVASEEPRHRPHAGDAPRAASWRCRNCASSATRSGLWRRRSRGSRRRRPSMKSLKLLEARGIGQPRRTSTSSCTTKIREDRSRGRVGGAALAPVPDRPAGRPPR
ncbi:MAG: hypothetical protein U1G05_09730 [Kiritimatiellia bacterium]